LKNLAGDRKCDLDIRNELEAAGIEVVSVGMSRDAEVPASLVGKLGPFTFTRGWRYWTVRGPMPLAAAQEMYADPVGVVAVRVAGNCTCPAPVAPWIETRRDANGDRYPIVDSYDIDSPEGLRLFADTVRRHGLDKAAPVVTEWSIEATEAVVEYFATTPNPSPLMVQVMLSPTKSPEVDWRDERIKALRLKHL
jgi:hypothetical protein